MRFALSKAGGLGDLVGRIHLQQSAEFLGYRKDDMPITEKVAS